MAWRTPRGFLNAIGAVKLSKLTNEPTQQSPIGTGDDTATKFTTPFALGQILPYFDSVLQTSGFTISRETGTGGRDELVFSPAPALDVVITATSPDGVNVDVLESAALAAQGDIRGMIDAALYALPADNAAMNAPQVLKWLDVLTMYSLAGDARRPGLLKAYPEIVERWIDVYGGLDSTLKRVAKGTYSLRGILPTIDPALTPGTTAGEFISNPVVYTPDVFRGVL